VGTITCYVNFGLRRSFGEGTLALGGNGPYGTKVTLLTRQNLFSENPESKTNALVSY